MHFIPLIRKPRCPTPTRKLRNGYVISTKKKNATPDYANCFLVVYHNGRVKVNFLCTMNVTAADLAGRSYRSHVEFFRV